MPAGLRDVPHDDHHHHDHPVVQRMGRRLQHGPARERHRDVLRRPHLRAPESDLGFGSLRRGNVYPTVRLRGGRLRRRAVLLGVCRRVRARMLSRARVWLAELRHAGDLLGGIRRALYVRLPVQPRSLRSVNHDVRVREAPPRCRSACVGPSWPGPSRGAATPRCTTTTQDTHETGHVVLFGGGGGGGWLAW